MAEFRHGEQEQAIKALYRAYKAGFADAVDGEDENFERFLGEEILRTEGIDL